MILKSPTRSGKNNLGYAKKEEIKQLEDEGFTVVKTKVKARDQK